MTSKIIFHYFCGRGIGEPIRLIFAIGGVEFDDRRYSIDEFSELEEFKAKLPFGQIPVLEIDGSFIGQTDSIARLAARLANLYPSAAIDAARSDMIVLAQAEIQSAIAKMNFDGVPGAPGTKLRPEDQRKKLVGEWCEAMLPAILGRLENLAGTNAMVGEQLSWADVCMFNRLNHLLDIDDQILSNGYPNLQATYTRIADLSAVKTWIAHHPEDYPRQHSAS
jgi:glutathione S-transferase